MNALTIWEPWAQLIVRGIKDVENRSWRATTVIGERLAVHAGLVVDTSSEARKAAALIDGPFPRGVILGTVRVVDIVRNHRSHWARPCQWHWVLADAEPLAKPIPARGKPGLWRWHPPRSDD